MKKLITIISLLSSLWLGCRFLKPKIEKKFILPINIYQSAEGEISKVNTVKTLFGKDSLFLYEMKTEKGNLYFGTTAEKEKLHEKDSVIVYFKLNSNFVHQKTVYHGLENPSCFFKIRKYYEPSKYRKYFDGRWITA